MARLWIIRTYVHARGTDAVEEWGLAPSAHAVLDTALEFLAVRPREQWLRPEFDALHREGKGLCEIRFKHGNRQYRPLGFFGPGRNEFTIVIGATKKGSRWDPVNAIETAQKRRAEIMRMPDVCSRPYEF
jgi:hypothetical protein